MTSRLCIALLFCISAVSAFAQSDSTMTFAAAATSKFVNLPNLPDCMTVAVQRGDPAKGPSVLLLKFRPGCTIPWHWHTAGESLMMVSGTGKMQMKDGKPTAAKPGDYVYLPGKSIHQFSAVTAVLLFDAPDGPFDIHYVDQSGKEIQPSDALKH